MWFRLLNTSQKYLSIYSSTARSCILQMAKVLTGFRRSWRNGCAISKNVDHPKTTHFPARHNVTKQILINWKSLALSMRYHASDDRCYFSSLSSPTIFFSKNAVSAVSALRGVPWRYEVAWVRDPPGSGPQRPICSWRAGENRGTNRPGREVRPLWGLQS